MKLYLWKAFAVAQYDIVTTVNDETGHQKVILMMLSTNKDWKLLYCFVCAVLIHEKMIKF